MSDVLKPPSAVATLREHGAPTIAQAAREIARSKLGQRETPGRRNEGTIVDWALEGLSNVPAAGDGGRLKPGWAFWCAFFACQCVRQALLLEVPCDPAKLRDLCGLAAGGGADELWQRLEARGMTVLHVPGQPPPEGVYFVFFIHLKEGKPVFHRDGRPNLRHVAIKDERAGGAEIPTLEGNHGDQVAEDSYALDHPSLYGYAFLPW